MYTFDCGVYPTPNRVGPYHDRVPGTDRSSVDDTIDYNSGIGYAPDLGHRVFEWLVFIKLLLILGRWEKVQERS